MIRRLRAWWRVRVLGLWPEPEPRCYGTLRARDGSAYRYEPGRLERIAMHDGSEWHRGMA